MPPLSLPPIPVGAFAAVRWVDGHFYLVRLLQTLPDGTRVQFSDNAIETVPPGSLTPIPAQPAFRVGDHVLAVWKTDRLFPGTVTAITSNGYAVAWHDGDPPLIVRPGLLTYLTWGNAAVAPAKTREASGWSDVTSHVLGPPMVTGAGGGGGGVPPPLPGAATPKGARLTIFVPGPVRPIDRGLRFVEPLQEALRLHGLGDVVDEGTEVAEADGRRFIKGCWISLAVSDAANALPTIRAVLKAAAAPLDTTITQHEPQHRVHRLDR